MSNGSILIRILFVVFLVLLRLYVEFLLVLVMVNWSVRFFRLSVILGESGLMNDRSSFVERLRLFLCVLLEW